MHSTDVGLIPVNKLEFQDLKKRFIISLLQIQIHPSGNDNLSLYVVFKEKKWKG